MPPSSIPVSSSACRHPQNPFSSSACLHSQFLFSVILKEKPPRAHIGCAVYFASFCLDNFSFSTLDIKVSFPGFPADFHTLLRSFSISFLSGGPMQPGGKGMDPLPSGWNTTGASTPLASFLGAFAPSCSACPNSFPLSLFLKPDVWALPAPFSFLLFFFPLPCSSFLPPSPPVVVASFFRPLGHHLRWPRRLARALAWINIYLLNHYPEITGSNSKVN